MEDWRGAVVVAEGPPWRILLTEVRQLPNGSWRYAYSFRPGRCCYFTVAPGPAMVSPYDSTFARLARDIGERYPASAR